LFQPAKVFQKIFNLLTGCGAAASRPDTAGRSCLKTRPAAVDVAQQLCQAKLLREKIRIRGDIHGGSWLSVIRIYYY